MGVALPREERPEAVVGVRHAGRSAGSRRPTGPPLAEEERRHRELPDGFPRARLDRTRHEGPHRVPVAPQRVRGAAVERPPVALTPAAVVELPDEGPGRAQGTVAVRAAHRAEEGRQQGPALLRPAVGAVEVRAAIERKEHETVSPDGLALHVDVAPERPEDEVARVGVAAACAPLAVEGPEAKLVDVRTVAREVEGPEHGARARLLGERRAVEREERKMNLAETEEVLDLAVEGEQGGVGVARARAALVVDREEAEAVGAAGFRRLVARAVEQQTAPAEAVAAPAEGAQRPEDVGHAAERLVAGRLAAVERAHGEKAVARLEPRAFKQRADAPGRLRARRRQRGGAARREQQQPPEPPEPCQLDPHRFLASRPS